MFFLTYLLSAAIICIVAWLTVHNETQEKLTLVTGFTALIGGILVYGYCFYVKGEGFPGILHTLLAVCWIFIGENGTEAAASVPIFGSETVTQGLLWVIHTFGAFTTISAVMSALAGQLLNRIRLRYSRSGELVLIYGVNTDSLVFAQELMEENNRRGIRVVFVDEKPDMDSVSLIDDFGGVLRTDREAFRPTVSFLRSVGMRPGSRRTMHVYALDRDMDRNLIYATDLMRICESDDIESSRIKLTVLGVDAAYGGQLQAAEDKYGYRSVEIFDEASLVSRVLIRDYPPYSRLTFKEDCTTDENFSCVVVGFGQIGQNILRNLIRNGQFVGSTFQADVFDPEANKVLGAFEAAYPELTKQYDINIHSFDGRSREYYDFLREKGKELKYIVICTGREEANALIAEDTCRFIRNMEGDAYVLQCSYKGIRLTGEMPKKKKPPTVYSPDILHSDQLDRMAMYLNCFYCREDASKARERWMECSPFDRESSRASADFIKALMYIAGTPDEDAVARGKVHWVTKGNPDDEVRAGNLARTEHLRWMAFHYTMGYRTMTAAEYRQRARAYMAALSRGEKPGFRVSKDNEKRIHAALIPWEALDRLSEAENKVATDRHTDFKDNDYTAVYSVPQILQGKRQGEEEDGN